MDDHCRMRRGPEARVRELAVRRMRARLLSGLRRCDRRPGPLRGVRASTGQRSRGLTPASPPQEKRRWRPPGLRVPATAQDGTLRVHRRDLLAARCAARPARRDEGDLHERLLGGDAERVARHGLSHDDGDDTDRGDDRERGVDPDHRRRRRRLRVGAQHHADRGGIRAKRGRGDSPRGPAVPEALRAHRRQDDRHARRGRGEVPGRGGRAGPARPGVRADRPHGRPGRRGRKPGRGHRAWSGLCGCRRGSRLVRVLQRRARAHRGLRRGHAARRTRRCRSRSTTRPPSGGTRIPIR